MQDILFDEQPPALRGSMRKTMGLVTRGRALDAGMLGAAQSSRDGDGVGDGYGYA